MMTDLAPSDSIGIYLLREIWQQFDRQRRSLAIEKDVPWNYMNAVFNTLGIGLEPALRKLAEGSGSFHDFEEWILKNGRFSQNAVEHFNSMVDHQMTGPSAPVDSIFGREEIESWNRDGYVVLKNAISKESCLETVDFICEKIGADLSVPDSWYESHALKQGIMVQLFNEGILDENRFSSKIKRAYEQLWGKTNLIVNMDRVSFNPPETDFYQFQGPNLHWDVSLKRPIPYGIQGLLYLTDTKPDQGAFTVIPGFHNMIYDWLDSLDAHPRKVDLLASFDERPIAGEAGDFIFWHHALPHGSRPNKADLPRIVQYINYQPIDLEYQDEWI